MIFVLLNVKLFLNYFYCIGFPGEIAKKGALI